MPPYFEHKDDMRVSSVVFCGGKNVKIILFKSGTSNTGKADARAAGVQTERIWKEMRFP